MARLSKHDLSRVISAVPENILELVKSHNALIAGGFIRAIVSRETPSDLDIFFNDADVANAFITDLAGSEKDRIFRTERAFSFSFKGLLVQAVHRWNFADSVDVLEHFDFTIACAALFWVPLNPPDESQWSSRVHEDFYADLAAKRLIYTSPVDPEPGGSMLRLLKFTARGFRITIGSLSKLITELAIFGDPSIKKDEFRKKIFSRLVELDPITKRKGFIEADEAELQEMLDGGAA
jgi:hypothetical protein